MSGFKNLIKNNEFLSLGGNIIYTLLGFVSFIFLTRTYTAGIFGGWVLYVTAATFIEMIRFGITRYAVVIHLSGADMHQRKSLLGSHWIISFVLSCIIAVIIILIRRIFPESINESGYDFFFKWYPLLVMANLPFNNSLSILQADQKFNKILAIRSFNIGSFVLFLGFNLYIFNFNIDSIILVHLLINLLCSIICIAFGWDGISNVFAANRKGITQIINFGKFSTGTTLGLNMLKSSDTILIGLSPLLGTAGVAYYSIPLKIIDLFEIPLRSSAATSFPRMSQKAVLNKTEAVRDLFYSYTGVITLVFIPLALCCIFFTQTIITLISGSEYIAASTLVQVYMAVVILLPFDRFMGISLDSLNQPHKNFYKVLIQNIISIGGGIGILLVYHQFFPEHNPLDILLAYAFLSILTIGGGLIAGFQFLKPFFNIEPGKALQRGLQEIFNISSKH